MKTFVDCKGRNCRRCVQCIEKRATIQVRLGVGCGNALHRFHETGNTRWIAEARGYKELSNFMRDEFPSTSEIW